MTRGCGGSLVQLPPQVQPGQVGNLFKGEPGFEDFRTRRRMCFVDFGTPIQGAVSECPYLAGSTQLIGVCAQRPTRCGSSKGTSLLRQTKGLPLTLTKTTCQSVTSSMSGKSESEMCVCANRLRAARRLRLGVCFGQESMEYTYYFCTCCGTKFCSLKSAPPLDTIAKRKTDGATALKEVFLADLYAHRGERKKIKRANGTEKQYPLTCTKCGIQIAYRYVPRGVRCVLIARRGGRTPATLAHCQSVTPSFTAPFR